MGFIQNLMFCKAKMFRGHFSTIRLVILIVLILRKVLFVSSHAPTHGSALMGDWQLGLGWPTLVKLAVRWAQLHRWLWHGAFEKFISVGVLGA